LDGNFQPPYWYPHNYPDNLISGKRISG